MMHANMTHERDRGPWPAHRSLLTAYAVLALTLTPLRGATAQDSVIVIDPDAPAAPAAQRAGLQSTVLQRVLGIFNDSATTRLEGAVSLPVNTRVTGTVAIWRGPLQLGGQIDGDLLVVNGDLILLAGSSVRGNILVVGG